MPILRDIDAAIEADQLLAAQRLNGRQGSLGSVAKDAVVLCRQLAEPAAIYEEFAVQTVDGPRVHLEGDHPPLTVGPKADLLTRAQRLVVAVCTIGPALEVRVRELHQQSEPVLSYLLDCAGVLTLGKVSEHFRVMVEGIAARRDWGVSPALSPGSLVGWSILGQRELCALLPITDIGVRLNDYAVLEPQKSSSAAIGMGPAYDSHHAGSICHYCSLRESCWRRREAAA